MIAALISSGNTSAAGRPEPLDDREIEFAAAGVADLAFLDRAEPGRAQKTLDRRLRRADPRPAPLLGAVGLGRGDAVGDRPPAGAASHSRADPAAGISAAASLSRTSPVRSSIARRCIRAGISSDRSSSSSSPQRFVDRPRPFRRSISLCVNPSAILLLRFPGESRDPRLPWIPACAGNARKTGLCAAADGRPATSLG